MSLKLTKILRNISKGILFLTGLGLLGYAGYLTYLSVSYRPYKVRVTNLTDTSFTVSWVTDSPMKGVVYFKDSDSFLPGPLSFFGSKVAVDDRDFAKAQSKCVEDFNRDVAKDVGDDFVVSGDNFDCEDIKVEKFGKYYTHHVTLKNLESEKEYYFRVGDGYFSWNVNSGNYEEFELKGISEFRERTLAEIQNIGTPNPVFGSTYQMYYDKDGILDEKTNFDSVVYLRVFKGQEELHPLSGVSNLDGGWSMDMANVRDEDGSLIDLSEGLVFQFSPQAENYNPVGKEKISYGEIISPLYLLGSQEDEWEKDNEEKSNFWDRFLEKFNVKVEAQVETCKGVGKCVAAGCQPNDCRQEAGPAFAGADCRKQYVNNGCKCDRPWACMSPYSRPDDANYIPQKDPETGRTKMVKAVDESGRSVLTPEEIAAGKDLATRLYDTYTVTKITTKVDAAVAKVSERKCYKADSGVCELDYHCVEGEGYSSMYLCNKALLLDSDIPGITCYRYSSATNTCQSQKIYKASCPASFYESLPACKTANNIEGIQCYKYDSLQGICSSFTKKDGNSCSPYYASSTACASANGLKTETEGCWYVSGNTCVYTDSSSCYRSSGYNRVLNSGRYESKITCEAKLEITQVKIDCKEGFKPTNAIVGGKQTKICVEQSDLKGWLNGCDSAWSEDENKVVRTEASGAIVIGCPEKSVTVAVEIRPGEGTVRPWSDEYYGCCRKDSGNGDYQYVIQAGDTGCDKYYTDVMKCSNPGVANVFSTVYCLEGDSVRAIVYKTLEKKPSCAVEVTRTRDWETYGGKNCCKTAGGGFEISTCTKGKTFWHKCIDLTSDDIDIQYRLPGFNLVQKASAQENTSEEDSLVLYLPEDGVYDVSLLNGTDISLFGDATRGYIFFYERNGQDGYQSPVDPSKPGDNEDILVSPSAAVISMSKVTSTQKVTLQRGLNIISFDFLPSQGEKKPLEADEFLKLVNTGDDRVSRISFFSGGLWNGGVSFDFESKTTKGNSFPLVFGKGYVVVAERETTISIPGYEISSTIPIALSAGWNLIGVHGYSTAFTARSLIDSINEVKGLTADNVSWWPTSKGKYEGLQVSEGQEYGLDFPISPLNGYFIRIKKYEPEKDTCKSIIWNPTGNLHGKCGTDENLFK